MTPDPATRLRTVARALEQVVIPSLPSDEVLAIEQATLSLGHIGMLIEQLRFLADYDAACLTDMCELAGRLGEAAAGGPRTEEAVESLRSALVAARDPGDTAAGAAAEARSRRNTVASAIDDLLRASAQDGDDDFRASSHRLVLDHGIRQSFRDRAWFKGSGLDPDRATLPDIPELMGRGA